MNISLRKISAISELKFKLFSRNMYFAVLPLMIVGMALLYRVMLKHAVEMGFAMVIPMNLGMVGITLTSYMIAEEKEKNTLRALMTSSVSVMDYLLGSSILPFVVVMGTSLILPLIMGVSYDIINLPMYIIFNVLATISMILIGFTFGITAKSQSQVSTNVLPVTMIISMLPFFAPMNKIIGQISGYTISGVFFNYLIEMFKNKNYMPEISFYLVFAAWVIIPGIIFILVYKKNGIDE